MPIQPFVPTRNRSQHPSTAVRYTLIGVYNKLLNPSKLPCLLSFFPSIISAALSCFNLLAESFTLVKIDDQFPQQKNESCVTQANTVYQAKAKFILARIGPSEINTVYCV